MHDTVDRCIQRAGISRDTLRECFTYEAHSSIAHLVDIKACKVEMSHCCSEGGALNSFSTLSCLSAVHSEPEGLLWALPSPLPPPPPPVLGSKSSLRSFASFACAERVTPFLLMAGRPVHSPATLPDTMLLQMECPAYLEHAKMA